MALPPAPVSRKTDSLGYADETQLLYNFVKIHSSIKATSAIEAGVTDFLWSMEDWADGGTAF